MCLIRAYFFDCSLQKSIEIVFILRLVRSHHCFLELNLSISFFHEHQKVEIISLYSELSKILEFNFHNPGPRSMFSVSILSEIAS